MKAHSIFSEYYAATPFYDRFVDDAHRAVTVIIPTIHTNELWEANLHSIFREIPVHQLLIGDGGCTDDSITIAQKFPRVVVHNHRDFKSLGYSIRKLIEAVETEWFVYLHSDVYLPKGWFEEMNRHRNDYDWFGCRMRQTFMIEQDNDYGERPYAGSQMGKKAAFINGIGNIDDDFVWRQEDFIFSDIVAKSGFKEGRVDSMFHYHQTIKKPSPVHNPQLSQFTFSATLSREEEERALNSLTKGIIKYLAPSSKWAERYAGLGIYRLIQLKYYSSAEIYSWISEVNPIWLPFVRRRLFKLKVFNLLMSVANRIKTPFLFLLK